MYALILITITSLYLITQSAHAKALDVGNPCPKGTVGRVIRVGGKNATFRHPADALRVARPGDKVLLEAGTHRGGIEVSVSGAPGRCISIEGERGALIRGGNFGISIRDRNFIAIRNLTLSGFQDGEMPTAIRVEGAVNGVEISGNLIEKVNSQEDAHGISVYGTSASAIQNVLIQKNEVRNCRLGSSETIVLNGNVEHFWVVGNYVHHNNNIGIDVIGHEGTDPSSGQDFARDGLIANNRVEWISSKENSKYKNKQGENELSAGAIYVDGGQKIRIFGNVVANSDIGIELASEHGGKATTEITVTRNRVSNSHQGNIMMGGFLADKGISSKILVEGNELAGADGWVSVNDEPEARIGGEIIIQHNTNGVMIRGNFFRPRVGIRNIVATGGNNADIVVEGNRYATSVRKGTGDLAESDGQNSQLVESAPAGR